MFDNDYTDKLFKDRPEWANVEILKVTTYADHLPNVEYMVKRLCCGRISFMRHRQITRRISRAKIESRLQRCNDCKINGKLPTRDTHKTVDRHPDWPVPSLVKS